ncbi:Glutathione S-transferase, protein [Metarhizium album ARSEF 1941]|uniref:Glutathione S-transferase, protein n=1 Tax=Metarhizium album (strain ARSEF 1941) TaxID=1081103 RepID=A0A0B2WXF2_METAS|nr:Glutathione S-transferase, protein [Metarhizium album ARSEF 1941]KHN97550.1 Glutathione S-transferase, protein [Metarhizium album ARSEF 1941]
MTEPDTKRVKTANGAPYELIYWPGIPGRGEFVRLLFEEAGVPYNDTAKSANDAVQTVIDLVSPDNKGDEINPPTCTCPALKHGDLRLFQTPNILLYLGPQLGLAPKEGNGIYHINQLVLTILDCFCNEVHDTHHPVAAKDYYEDQKPEAKRRAKSFIEERLPKFLAYLERVLEGKASGDGPWLYGGKLTYADLVLFQGIHGTEYAFPKTMKNMRDSGKYDRVFELFEAVKERPNIKEYLASSRRCQYGNGIWRHYPELEED